jgi:hypothetical protein
LKPTPNSNTNTNKPLTTDKMSRYWIYLGLGEGNISMIACWYGTWKVLLRNGSQHLLEDVAPSGEIYIDNNWVPMITKKNDLHAITSAHKNAELCELMEYTNVLEAKANNKLFANTLYCE